MVDGGELKLAPHAPVGPAGHHGAIGIARDHGSVGGGTAEAAGIRRLVVHDHIVLVWAGVETTKEGINSWPGCVPRS